MLVRSLIGRTAGEILEQPFAVAQSNLAAGTVAVVSEEEVAAAGMAPRPEGFIENIEVAPSGYRVEPDPDGRDGYVVYDPGGVMLTPQPLANAPAARDWANSHYTEATALTKVALDRPKRVRGGADAERTADEDIADPPVMTTKDRGR